MTTTSSMYEAVDLHYSKLALHHHQTQSDAVANAFGYSSSDLASIPIEANLGVSCGNPIATANLQEGETFVDLGSGGGLDVFLASKRVGPSGKCIGIDMNDKMLDLARKNALKGGYTNVGFVKGRLNEIPLPSSSTNVVSSNCVINLVPEAEKPDVFKEIYRILKPGGRLAVSDILAIAPLPEAIKEDISMYAGCIAGASLSGLYEEWMTAAGFVDIVFVNTKKDLNVYKDLSNSESHCCGSNSSLQSSEEGSGPMHSLDLNSYASAFQIYALKNST